MRLKKGRENLILFIVLFIWIFIKMSPLSHWDKSEIQYTPLIFTDGQTDPSLKLKSISEDANLIVVSETKKDGELNIYDPVDGRWIDIHEFNQYSAQQMTHFSGIGEKTSENIIMYIQSQGPLSNFYDLLEVKGIGEAKLKSMINASN